MIDGVALQNAKASVISAVVSREQTPSSTGLQAIMSALRGTGHGHNARLLEAVDAVKEEDCMRVLNTYLLNLFDPKTSNMCVTTSPSKLQEVCCSHASLDARRSSDSVTDLQRLPRYGMEGRAARGARDTCSRMK